MFYDFRQNNSGGSFDFDGDRGISVSVIVEADSADEANERAEEIGLYFDGSGDCECCGDRWSSQWRDDAGDEVPSIYGQPIAEYTPHIKWSEKDFPEVFVHYKDGTVTGHISE